MDGNGRWAASRGLPRTAGHAAGVSAALACVDGALDLGIEWLTLFVFSTENWIRPKSEVESIIKLNMSAIRRYGEELRDRGTRVRYLGSVDDRMPQKLYAEAKRIERLTAGNSKLTVTLAFNHGGRSELVDAVRSVVRSRVPADEISEATVSNHTQYPDMPDIDLLIRTSGEHRISNFMLWRLAYAEILFTDTLWPDFSRADLVSAIRLYQERCRRYGGLLSTEQGHQSE